MRYMKHGIALCAFLCLVACASTQHDSGTGGVAEDSGTSEHWHYIVDKYVVGDYFDYAALAKSNRDKQTLDKHMQWQSEADVKSWSRESQIAFYINAYNSACVKTIVDHYPVHSPMDIDGFFVGIKKVASIVMPFTATALEAQVKHAARFERGPETGDRIADLRFRQV